MAGASIYIYADDLKVARLALEREVAAVESELEEAARDYSGNVVEMAERLTDARRLLAKVIAELDKDDD